MNAPCQPHPIVQGDVFSDTQASQDNSDRQPLRILIACLCNLSQSTPTEV